MKSLYENSISNFIMTSISLQESMFLLIDLIALLVSSVYDSTVSSYMYEYVLYVWKTNNNISLD